ncbi:PREDICTED: uncharacterized protein LOC101370171 [Odobenus rosmarus divergens]|uniref:Uncharacterized protein LOC101370171 n=1 Tax=Odobenus rosmarus divergens TaxID=9708 RepID=A0A9B0LIJ9_ODORO
MRPASRVSSEDGAGPVPTGGRCWGGFLVQGFSLGGGGGGGFSFSLGPVAASSSRAPSAGGSLGRGGGGSPPKGPPGPRGLCARCSARGLTGTAAWGTLCPSTSAGDGSPRAPAMMAVAALSSLAANLPSRSGGDSCSACRLAVTSDSFSAATADGSSREKPESPATAARVGRRRAAPGVPPLPAWNGAVTARRPSPPHRLTSRASQQAPGAAAGSREPSPGAGSGEGAASRGWRTSSRVKEARAPRAGPAPPQRPAEGEGGRTGRFRSSRTTAARTAGAGAGANGASVTRRAVALRSARCGQGAGRPTHVAPDRWGGLFAPGQDAKLTRGGVVSTDDPGPFLYEPGSRTGPFCLCVSRFAR